MITPLILILIMKCFKRKNFLIVFFLYLIITNATSLALSVYLTDRNQMFAFYLLLCRSWELGLGGFIAVLLH